MEALNRAKYLPNELQAEIVNYLGMANPLRLLMSIKKGLAIPPGVIEKQQGCWVTKQFTSLFRDGRWLEHVCSEGFNPVLVGNFLPGGYVVLYLPSRRNYEALATANEDNAIACLDKLYKQTNPDLLLASLGSPKVDVETLEVRYPERTLNIGPVLEPTLKGLTTIPDFNAIFTGLRGGTCVAYYVERMLVEQEDKLKGIGGDKLRIVDFPLYHARQNHLIFTIANSVIEISRGIRGGPLAEEGSLMSRLRINEAVGG